jgi:hypothetical protein
MVPAVAFSALSSCGNDTSLATNLAAPDASSEASSHPDPTPGPQDGTWAFTVIKEDTFPINGLPVKCEFIRADRPDGRHSYLFYVHSYKPGAVPLLIENEPYHGIDWTGEDVDTRWAALGTGGHPDVDAPNYNGNDQIAYALQSPQDAVTASVVSAFNGYATIRAYARFYAGGSLEDDVLDAAAPYFFARTRPTEIDLSRIGSIGASYGAMMALFGASHSPKDAAPRAIAAMSPPSDWVDLWPYSMTELPAEYPKPDDVHGFYSPYWRRALPTLGSPPEGAAAQPYTHAGLCASLPGHVLAAHDSWDIIIPVRQTQNLVKACSNVEPVYWPRGPLNYAAATAIDHGPAPSEGPIPTMDTFSYTFLVEQIAPEGAAVLFSAISTPALVTNLKLIAAAQKAGDDVSYILPRLRELVDPRLQLYEGNNKATGSSFVAAAINQVYGTTFDETSIRTQLATGLPPPP